MSTIRPNPTLAVLLRGALLAAAVLCAPALRAAEEPVLNLYSARHYQTDEALYANFTKATGIRINRIEAGDDQLLERIRTEAAQSPADVLLIVDAARLWSAQQQGLFQPVKSAVLSERIPAALRDPDGHWFGFSSRARVIVHNKATVKPTDVATYESLADPRNKGRVCTRSGSHPYNLSLPPRPGRAASSPTWRARRGAATPTRSRRWRPASAAWRSPTPITTCG